MVPHQFVLALAAPEIHAGHLEKLARGLTEELDQSMSIGSISGFSGNAKQKILKALIGPRGEAFFLRNEGAAAGNAESRVESGRIMFAIHKCLNLLGNYLSSQFESSEMG
jgi:hypothetical protein